MIQINDLIIKANGEMEYSGMQMQMQMGIRN